MTFSHTHTQLSVTCLKFQHGGDLVEAAKWMDEARILDTADRFVNCKCVKYFFRVNRVERAIEVAGLFTRVRWLGGRGEGRLSLTQPVFLPGLLVSLLCSYWYQEGPPTLETMDDMQCMWFQTELAHAYHRMGKLGEALQKLHEIDKVRRSIQAGLCFSFLSSSLQHFCDIIDDQFDFHGYTMRKVTLRAYLE